VSNNIDLNNPPPNHRYTVVLEKEETPGDRRVRWFKEVVLFLFAIGSVGAIY
jgi:hypothetical protein